MKIVVIGGTGLIGSKVVANLTREGDDVLPASPDSGVNTITGEGLDSALEDAQVVVDVSNSPSFEDAAVMDFFTTATTNLMKAETVAGVDHHVALSIVNNDLIPDSGYMRAKSPARTDHPRVGAALLHRPRDPVLRVQPSHRAELGRRWNRAAARRPLPADRRN